MNVALKVATQNVGTVTVKGRNLAVIIQKEKGRFFECTEEKVKE